jgi:hypothetical protein
LTPKVLPLETVDSLESVFRLEMSRVDSSMVWRGGVRPADDACGPDYNISVTCLRDVGLAEKFDFDPNRHWPLGVGSDISRNFIFRSLYLEQVGTRRFG